MTLAQILAVLRARWLAALLTFALVFGGIVGITLMLPKEYTATASVLVDIKNADPLTGQNFGGVAPLSFMVTQVDVIRSGRVVLQVIDRLGLRGSPELRQQWMEDTEGQGTFDAWLMELLRKRLEVRPTKDSGALNINYASPDPRFSAALANAFAEAYIATSVQLRTEPARQFGSFFEAQAKSARDAYETAQARLSAFQQKNGLVTTDERFDVETARLQELSSQQLMLQALSAESRGRTAQAQSNGTELQEVLNNPLLAQLTAEKSRLDVKIQEMATRLGESHPQLIEARAAMAELQRRINTETRRVTGSVSVNNDVVQSRLGVISASVAEQRAKVLRLKQQRDEAAVLERDVESKRLAYQSLLQRENQVSLESQSDRSNVSLLESATPPLKHSFPKIPLHVAIALVLGAIFALAVALLREWRDRRFRTLDDAQDVLRVRVIGVIPKVSPAMLSREAYAPALVRPAGTT